MDPSVEQVAILGLACGALLVRVGLVWSTVGLARAKFAASTVVRSIAEIAIASLAFWAFGSAIQNGQWGQLFDANGRAGWTQFLQLALVLIATAPLVGALGERSRLLPVLLAPIVLGGLVVPLCARWAWGSMGDAGVGTAARGGWLKEMGFFDAAGAAVLHVSGGLFAGVGAYLVGPRTGKYNRDGSSNLIPGHSVPMASLGVVLLFVGWLPYVLGATVLYGGFGAKTPMNVILAASSGALAAMLLGAGRYGKVDVMLTCSGLIGGLVAITGPAGALNSVSAVVIGMVAGLIVPIATVMLDLVWKIDDPAGGVAVNVVGGAWGILATAMFAPAGGMLDRLYHLGVQGLGLVVISAIAAGGAVTTFVILKKCFGLRLSDDAEYDGADLAEHDLNSYPDFQQTMIKSYHLREA
jgi:Amt family ammonium transporter